MTATPKDLQDEVGRLRAELKTVRIMYGHAFMEARALMDRDAYELFISRMDDNRRELQTPPESADECKHPRIYTAQDGHRFCDECEAYLGEESTPKACEHHWRTLSSGKEFCGRCKTERDTPQACEHKGGRDTYQGKPFCKRCGKTVEPNAPQEPKEGERDG